MNNLFSVFEPSSFFNMNLNWVSSSILMINMTSYWMMKSSLFSFLNTVKNYVFSELKTMMPAWSSSSNFLIPLSLFIFILSNNFLGLFPYIFTSSSHLIFTISMALPLWLGHMFFGWTKTPTHMLAHLVPLSTPLLLMSFMVVIELISNIIRPLTLSVRLAANMTAGHLLLNLLGSQLPNSAIYLMVLIMISVVMLLILEVSVSLIQAYVFSVLSTLYLNEVNNPQFEY